jgi:hypothetical protein
MLGQLGRPHHILLCYYGNIDAIIAPTSDVRTAMLVSLMIKVLCMNFRSMWYTSYKIHWRGMTYIWTVLIRSKKMQQYAGIYLLQVYSICFGRPWRPSSGVQKTLTAAFGTGHSNGATTFLQRGLIRPRWWKVVAPLLWPVPEAAVTVFCTPDNGRDGRPKQVE